MEIIDFEIHAAHIALDDLLKVTGVAHSGGAAKGLIADGKVRVDGDVETRKACKIQAGQVIDVQGQRIRIHAPTLPMTFDDE